jgi:hypothetical protein
LTQWISGIVSRTVIQNLTASQAKAYGLAIRENPKLETIVSEMRRVSLKILELTTEGEQKRKRRKRKDKPLF